MAKVKDGRKAGYGLTVKEKRGVAGMTKQQETLRHVAKFLTLLSLGYPATRQECKTVGDICWLMLPMKNRLSKEEVGEMRMRAPNRTQPQRF